MAKNPADAVLAEHSWSDPDQGFPSLMDAVLRWVETRLASLSLEKQLLRQEMITSEILELASGARALAR